MNTPTQPINEAVMELLGKVERLLPDEYKMTVLLRHSFGTDFSIVVSTDDLPAAAETLSAKVGAMRT